MLTEYGISSTPIWDRDRKCISKGYKSAVFISLGRSKMLHTQPERLYKDAIHFVVYNIALKLKWSMQFRIMLLITKAFPFVHCKNIHSHFDSKTKYKKSTLLHSVSIKVTISTSAKVIFKQYRTRLQKSSHFKTATFGMKYIYLAHQLKSACPLQSVIQQLNSIKE